jgi:hypothetical protein
LFLTSSVLFFLAPVTLMAVLYSKISRVLQDSCRLPTGRQVIVTPTNSSGLQHAALGQSSSCPAGSSRLLRAENARFLEAER